MDRSCERLEQQMVPFKTMLSQRSDEGIWVIAGDYGVTIGAVKAVVKHVDKVTRKYSLGKNPSFPSLHVVLFTAPAGLEYGLMRSGYSRQEAIRIAAVKVITDGTQVILYTNLLNQQQGLEEALAEGFRCALGLETLAPGA